MEEQERELCQTLSAENNENLRTKLRKKMVRILDKMEATNKREVVFEGERFRASIRTPRERWQAVEVVSTHLG